MYRPPPALPLTRRAQAHSLLHPELIAALSRCPLSTTREFIEHWLEAVAWVASVRGTIVFDRFVVGAPSPALLEIAYELRSIRRAEARGDFDDEEAEWYDRHDDDAEPWEPPTIPERVVASLHGRPGFEAMATRLDIQALIGRTMRVDRTSVFDVIEVDLAVERLITDVADVCRIGDLVIVDGRLPAERSASWDWAA